MNELYQFTIIDYTTNPLGVSTLIEEPVGWDGVEFELTRLDTHGFVNKINIDGIDFEFRDIAKTILSNAYYDYGINAKIELQIEWRGNPSNAFQTIYIGLFNLASFKEYCGVDCFVSCGINQDGCYYLFANKKNQSVDLGSLVSFDGTALPAYTWLNNNIDIPAKDLRFVNNGNSPNGYSETFNPFLSQADVYIPLPPIGFWNRDLIYIVFGESVINSSEIPNYNTFSQIVNFTPNTVTPIPTNYILEPINNGSLVANLEFSNETNIKCSNEFTISIDVDLDLTIAVDVGLADFIGGYQLVKISSDKQNVTILYQGTPIPSTGFNATRTVNINETINITTTLFDGESLFWGATITSLVTNLPSSTNYLVDYTVNTLDVEITNNSNCIESAAKVSLINETLSRQVEAYTNDCIRVKSDYYGRTDSEPYTSVSDGCGSLRSFSSGLQIRGARREDLTLYTLNTSFEYLFNNLDKIDCLGYGLEDDSVRGGSYKWLRVENREYFYQNATILTCDYPSIVKKSVDRDRTFSQLMIGYKNWASEEDGGRQDIFADREYATNIDRVNNSVDLRSELMASDFALEVTRRIYGLSKKDWRYDENIFIICLERSGGSFIVELATNAANYVYSIATTKNLRITPIRNLLRQIPFLVGYIKTSFDFLFKFRKGTANHIAEIKVDWTDDCILEEHGTFLQEDQDIDKNTFETITNAEPVYTNELIEFEYPITCSDWTNIMANPYGKIAYNCPNDLDYKYGYIKQIKFNPTQGIAEITLKQAYA